MSFQAYALKTNAVAVYINSSIFNQAKNIIDKVDSMYGECFEGGFNSNVKNSVLILYVDMENSDNQEKFLNINNQIQILNKNVNNIKGFLRLELYENHIEIYDVCTGKNNRKRGVMHALFENILFVTPKKYKFFWLGVTFDNPDRDNTINFYLKNGFYLDSVVFKTPSNVRLKSPVISFISSAKHIFAGPKNKNVYGALSNIECDFNFILKWKDAIYIQNNVYNRNVETGGTMDLKMLKKDVLLSPNLLSVVYGDPTTFSVNPPVYYVNWHSHPGICYTKNQCYIGWPSSADMRYLYAGYNLGLLLHFVFTAEGLYSIKLSKDAMKFMYMIALNKDWLTAVGDLIYYRFAYIEKYRLFVETRDRQKNIAEFLNRANTFTLKDYVIKNDESEKNFLNFMSGKDYFTPNENVINAIKYFEQYSSADFPLFEVNFYSSEYILSHVEGVQIVKMATIRTPFKNYCPNF